MVKLFVLVVAVAFAAALIVRLVELVALVYGLRTVLAALDRLPIRRLVWRARDRRAEDWRRRDRQRALEALSDLHGPSAAPEPVRRSVAPYMGVNNPGAPSWYDQGFRTLDDVKRGQS